MHGKFEQFSALAVLVGLTAGAVETDAAKYDKVLKMPGAEASFETLIAHRGESFDAPENTLPAYRMAVERGFGFECDIYRSKDGRLFTFHDSSLTRTTAGACTQRCDQASWAETVSKVNVGGWGKWKGSRYDPTRPALFEEVLALARPGRKIYVELKCRADAVSDVRKAVEAEPKATPDSVLFICFDSDTCAELKRQLPRYKTYWLTVAREKMCWDGKDATRPPVSAVKVIERLAACKADGVDIHYERSVVTADYIRQIRRAGYEVHVWTVDRPEIAAEAFARGAQTVTTNRAKYILDTLVFSVRNAIQPILNP